MQLNAKQIANYTGGTFLVDPIDAGALSTGITWDSRDVKPNDVYLALQGERVDGHDFVASALRAGANVALVMMPPDASTCLLAKEMGAAIIEVSRTETALRDLARAWRGFLKGRVIGLTGSSGKTTTKNLIRDVLSCAGSVVATKGNQNNELGVPKTLLSADPQTDYIVVEMGMRGMGQLEELCEFVRPDWGVITNVGESHIELLGSRENIAKAKAELLQALPNGLGRAYLCASDDFTDFVRDYAQLDGRGIAVTLFGMIDGRVPSQDQIEAGLTVWASDAVLNEQGCPQFTLCAHRGGADRIEQASCSLNLRGMHNVFNACAAAALGMQCGLDIATIAQALHEAQPEAGRQEVLMARGGFTIVNDAYNANPDSMRASLVMFSSMRVAGKRVAVLGDMAELGDFGPACHDEIGRLVASQPIDILITIGELGARISDAAVAGGMDQRNVMHVSTYADIFQELDILLRPGDAVLVKASNCMGLSKIVEGLLN
ncbi:MAG: UDP-N-acetylmuramoyl-tripeptide--D-alanyl-D-alanine ligase [Eggerthellaceae bacterium]|nr:UDP-N-acetylmuramoyl-tripeptide--D-alanyl-D-alanine ligase [Eggerthellaceae bacterium]